MRMHRFFSARTACAALDDDAGISRISIAFFWRPAKRSLPRASLDGSHTRLETDFFDRTRMADDAGKNDPRRSFPRPAAKTLSV